jgi:hypothetical protein
VEQTLSSRAKNWLYSPSAAVLSRSPLGHTEIVWPGRTDHAAEQDDLVGARALVEIQSEINRRHAQLPIDAGCFVAFNNLRGVHGQAASSGYCLYYKTYARHSLRALQVNGEPGPVFSLTETRS